MTQCSVFLHRRAGITAGATQDGRPEIHQFFQMMIPVFDFAIEDGAEHVVTPYLRIKSMHQLCDFFVAAKIACGHLILHKFKIRG
ncbi:hypothetical protein D3C86_2122450 [compost metagenome]